VHAGCGKTAVLTLEKLYGGSCAASRCVDAMSLDQSEWDRSLNAMFAERATGFKYVCIEVEVFGS